MKIYAVGIGPGDMNYIVQEAKNALLESDVIVGYTEYVKLVKDLIKDKEIISTGMTGEIERCKKAFEKAEEGKNVAVISSGDAGVYGMASLLFEMTQEHTDTEIIVIPGITAANAAASVLGSPLSNDYATISLSDLLTPWKVIEKRLNAASQADMVICLYNPKSKKRINHLKKACEISLKYKDPETCCGYVKNALRKDTVSKLCTLKELMFEEEIDMFTTVIIGNSSTKIINGKLVTTRGYKL